MLIYTVRRLLLSIPTLLAVLTLVFVIVRVLPGDPAQAALGDYASKEAVEALRARMGLDKPLAVQYVTFLAGLLRGDLGNSMKSGKPVAEQIGFVLPHTLQLTLASIVVGVVFGVPLGIVTAVRRNGLMDYFGRIFSLAGLSIPAFYLGILLMLIFGLRLGWFPILWNDARGNLIAAIRQLVLPALTLGLIMTAYVTRMTRSAMLNILGEDYVRTARAKGLAERVVMFRHALRSALIPIVSIVGIFAVSLIGSSVMTEIVFSRPGLGKLMVDAVKQRDYTTLQSVMVVYAFLIVIINLVVDLLYGLVDPRVRYD
ncbi:ABC transporter permease [Litorilinea aerophila]|uniref:ABC transporter permease n=1 Tax=Litorilinea aerophila TaxID=1204385 RepID=A0A540VIP9_9CHLR|nr:ABC transporter permease [Litorilinea aerophila]MCC9075848.1 ABC transporter permease [Litorilinea aerophila]GIV77222.1 MAG: peptide ABC transporter permease [Litorilinea sp.]